MRISYEIEVNAVKIRGMWNMNLIVVEQNAV